MYLSRVVDGPRVAVVVDPGEVAAVNILAALVVVVAVIVVHLVSRCSFSTSAGIFFDFHLHEVARFVVVHVVRMFAPGVYDQKYRRRVLELRG